MGAADFMTRAVGLTAGEAFAFARQDALNEHGRGGYTGTIAEKGTFRMIALRERETVASAVERFSRDPNHFTQDKWGPAGCIDAGPSELRGHRVFVFFGMASS